MGVAVIKLDRLRPLVYVELHQLAHQHSARTAPNYVCWVTGMSKLKPVLALLPRVRPIAASRLLGW